MAEIRTVQFNEQTSNLLKRIPYGTDWPVVYVINNATEAYVGETVDASTRMSQHWMNPERQRLTNVSVITDDTFNKSVILDLEAFLIKHMFADGKFQLQNGNAGLHLHNYFNRTIYEKRFREIWNQLHLQATPLATKNIEAIENSDLFKYSPYTALSSDQFSAVAGIISRLRRAISSGKQSTTVVQGGPGTGKTILAVYLMKLLSERNIGAVDTDAAEDDSLDTIIESLRMLPDLKIAFVVPMQSLRKTLKNVFSSIRGLSPNMIISPVDVPKSRYDLLIVDEAHRLRRRKGLSQYPSFDKNNKLLGLTDDGTELDWITLCSKHQVFFYDEFQSIKPADVAPSAFKKLLKDGNTYTCQLTSQFRCKGGDDYIEYITHIMSNDAPSESKLFQGYELKLFYDVNQMVESVRKKDAECGLCRTVAGFSWKWISKDDPTLFDIDIQGHKFRWNTTAQDWVNSPTAIDEIGCIHTIQGYDLNYAGVIFGNEIDYDWTRHRLTIDKSEYQDTIGKASVSGDENALIEYIRNIYRTLMTRGIRGTFVYACRPGMRKYLSKFMAVVNEKGSSEYPDEKTGFGKPISIQTALLLTNQQQKDEKNPRIPMKATVDNASTHGDGYANVSVGMIVHHKLFGDGIVREIDRKGGKIKVAFSSGDKSFVFPQAFEQSHLSTK